MASVKDLLVNGSSRFIGKIYASDQFISQIANGTAPFVISSSTLVTNLNSDLLDGYHASDFYTKTDADGRYVLKSGDTMTGHLKMSGTYNLASSWDPGVIAGSDGHDKVVLSYLASSTSGAVIGGHNSALNDWAPLNIAGTALIFRYQETEKMRMDSAGNFGIGTTSPSYKLHIVGTEYVSQSIRMAGGYPFYVRDSAEGWNMGIFGEMSGNDCMTFVADNAVTSFMFCQGQGNLSGWTSGKFNSVTPAMQIKNNSVYINKLLANGVSPVYKLYVEGQVGIKTLDVTEPANLNFPHNEFAINFRPGGSYTTGFYYGTYGNEFISLLTQQSVTSIIFGNGYNPYSATSGSFITGDGTNYTYGASTNVIQIKSNCMNIGGVWGHNVTPDYKLKVNGNTYIDGRTIVNYAATNGTSALQINAGRRSYAYALDIQSSIAISDTLVAFIMGINHATNNQFSGLFKYVGSGSSSNLFGFGFYANDFLLNLRADGYVGIGTQSPLEKLHVTGNQYITGYINFNDHGYLMSGRSTSFNYGYTFHNSGNDLTNSMGMFSGPASEEGGIVVTPDTCFLYNSSDSGWNFQCFDKDLGGDLTANNGSPDEAGSTTRTFGIRQSSYVAWSRGGFQKNGSSDSYVLLGGGGHYSLNNILHGDSYGTMEGVISDCNSVSVTGIYSSSGFSNRPDGVSNWGTLFNLRLYNSNNLYHRQLFFDCYGTDRIWTRSDSGGTWTGWRELISVKTTSGTSVASLDCDQYTGIYVARSSSETMSFSTTPAEGKECHIVIYNNGSSNITITLPTSYRRNVASIVIAAGAFGEVNILTVNSIVHIRAV